MLAKCANPSCGARFHRFNEGKLFRFATHSKEGEYFWLCGQCAAAHVLVPDSSGKPQLKPKPKAGLRAEILNPTSADWMTKHASGDVAQHVMRRGRHRSRQGQGEL